MQATTPGDVEWMIAHGSRMHGMPAFGNLQENERWQLVSYIQSLNAKPAP
jgi:mono/diheme cytochrome c family protein